MSICLSVQVLGVCCIAMYSVHGPCKYKHIKSCKDIFVYFGQRHAATTAAASVGGDSGGGGNGGCGVCGGVCGCVWLCVAVCGCVWLRGCV